jgi:glycosyltransferase involved in cell wall biosynthesis
MKDKKEMKVAFVTHVRHQAIEETYANSVKARIIHLPKLYEYTQLTIKRKIIIILFIIRSLYESFKLIKIKEEIIIFNGGTNAGLIPLIAKFNKNKKIVYLDADLLIYNLSKETGLLGKIKKFIFKEIIFKNVNYVVSVSEINFEIAKKYFYKTPFMVCHSFKRIKNIPIKRKNYGLYIGRLDPDKNIAKTISIGLNCPYFNKFIVIGKGAYENELKKLSKVNTKLIYIPYIKDPSKYYNLCKFLIHLPEQDPHPCTTMEAASARCIPIISKGTGTKYLFNKKFIVNDSNNQEEINNLIKNINSDYKHYVNELKKTNKNLPKLEHTSMNFKKALNEVIND